ncbi:MAG: helix-hairpin-helix domain-containing protein [Chloroflexota bacterium]|nr:helix-hairpin-helix domain-containing protein [Chloroflexota bacterium]
MKKWAIVALGVVFGLLGAGAVFLASRPPRGVAIQLLPPPASPTPAPIQVYVTGAVDQPGVYALPLGSRVEEALDAAGGFADNAQPQSLNLAAQLQDGDQLDVPAVREAAAVESSDVASDSQSEDQPSSEPGSSIININTASQEELETLSGIGPVTANKIIEYREANGCFAMIEEIQKVSGIGPATFEKMEIFISVEK